MRSDYSAVPVASDNQHLPSGGKMLTLLSDVVPPLNRSHDGSRRGVGWRVLMTVDLDEVKTNAEDG